ncbi:putative mediator of RNA polymerase II transcription subunit 26c [Curcuma longa]|uniref:putative mediator of RNA polymerase II transcription subunit 26c n=1 Tax=Curcuma longa TaxID=136217 RepID=UPI003D9E68EC
MEISSLFLSEGADIFQIIENAILVAAVDHPDELERQRDSIVELCFKSLLPPFPQGAKADEDLGLEKVETEEAIKKEIKKEEEDRSIIVVEEVTRIKDILYDHHHQTDDVLFDSLRNLQQLKITYDILKEMQIGWAVKVLHKHTSKNIRHLARAVTLGWRKVVDEWVETTDDAITTAEYENKPDSAEIPLTKVHEERSVEEKVEIRKQETKPQLPLLSTQELHRSIDIGREDRVNVPRKESKPRGVAYPEPGRLPKLASGRQLPLQIRKPSSIPQRQCEPDDRARSVDSDKVLEQVAGKRKLNAHDGYQRDDINVKKQRTIKVTEQRNMPKKGGRRTLRPIQKLKKEITEWAKTQFVKPPQNYH